jgi:predicted metal-dependent peptidase
MNEPFFAGLSRRIDKRKTTDIPTAGVTVDKKTAQFVLMYNPSFFEGLSDTQKLGVLKHEFYHLVFEHVTGRKPEGGLTKIDNMCMDLAINSHLINELPDNYEWYKKNWQGMDKEEGEPGDGEGGEGSGNPSDSFDDHSGWDDIDNTENEIAKERLKEAIKKAAEEASQAGSWGSVPAGCRKEILDRLKVRVNWEKALRYFVKTSQKAEKRSTVRRINKRFPYIHPGKKVKRTAKFAVSIDQSGSVDDEMLAKFFSALDKLAKLASFTVVPFDTEVCEEHVFEWKKGKRYKAERVRYGGTCFDAPTKWVNERSFDGHIVLTDMMAPKPVASKCKRLWVTTAQYAERPFFETPELVIVVE